MPPELCGKCGAPLRGSKCPRCPADPSDATHTVISSSSSSSSEMDEGRFPPGTVLGGRYRVVSRVGKCGMGEVYRANDLMLGQTVALKFLPETWARDEAVVARFRNEVRTARMVTHPNVCRVHDLGEADGRLFLSMEFVDGEDLASLLRRIGRLPEDKGLEIARKLCAGLAAAHEKGVIHRDLKPANVMIDGRGQVVITDFGLAGLAGSIRDSGSGTPAYMAPEQKSGAEVTARTDLYALGLVLHEVFTGKRPGESTSSQSSLPAAVATVLERCLETDPLRRPASALAVARALPGGDPLAAALAAGETPSPELVAASGSHQGLKPRWAVVLLAFALAGPFIRAGNADRARTRESRPPEELNLMARHLVRRLQGVREPANEIRGVTYNYAYRSRLSQSDVSPAKRKDSLWSPQQFWYRSGPLPYGSLRQQPSAQLSVTDPPLTAPGMALAVFDMRGRLIRYEAVPDPSRPAPPVEREELFKRAGIDPSRLSKAGAPALGDESWTYRDNAGLTYSVVIATERGGLTRFEVSGNWDEPYEPSPASWLIEVVLVAVSAWLAWRNWRRGRADLRGAASVALLLAGLMTVSRFLRGADLLHWNRIITPIDQFGIALLLPSMVGLAYLAMEPYVRRRWPQVLVTWTRLLRGEWKDVAVHRDILIGMASFTMVTVPLALAAALAQPIEMPYPAGGFLGGRFFLATLLDCVFSGITRAVMVTFFIFLLRLVLRRDWAAGLAYTALFLFFQGGALGQMDAVMMTFGIVVGASNAFLLLRFGFLVTVAREMVVIGADLYQTLDPNQWFSGYSYLAIALFAALALVTFRVSLAGQKLLQDEE